MENTADQQNRDLARGIENITSRYKKMVDARTLESELQQKSNGNNRELQGDEGRVIYGIKPQRQSVMGRRVVSKNSAVDQSVAKMKHVGLKRGLARFGLPFLGLCALFQIAFAVGSGVGFGLEAARMAVCDTTIVSFVCRAVGAVTGVIDSITGIDLAKIVSFAAVGFVFNMLILLITILVMVVFAFLFRAQGTPAFESVGAKFLAVIAFGLNLVPFLNIIPIIEIWALGWVIYSMKPKTGLVV